MNLAHKTTKVQVVGASGTGKTSFFLSYFLKAKYGQKFIFDHEGEFTHRIQSFWSRRFGVQQEDNPYVGFISKENQLEQQFEKPVVVFDPSELFEGDLPGAFDFWCDAVFQRCKAANDDVSRLFACDELQNITGTDVLTPYLAKVLETGRRYSLDWLGISQALNLIHNRIRAQVTNCVAFRTTEKKGLEFLEEKGFDASEITSLPDFHFVERNLKTGETARGILERIA